MAGRSLIRALAGAALCLSPALLPVAAADDGGDPDARALAREAQRNLRDADSLRLKLTDRAAAGRGKEVASMDLALDRRGNCAGAFRMGADGGRFEIVKRGAEVWMKADRNYWKAQLPGHGAETADLVRDRYVHGTTDESAFEDFGRVCDLKEFQKDLTLESPDESLTKDGRTTVDGVRVITLRGTEDGVPTTLYITSDRPHLLVESVQKGAGTDRTAGISDYGRPVPSDTPAPDDSVDLSDLERESGTA
jgi:hypothetical protein